MIVFSNTQAVGIDHTFNYLGDSLCYSRTNKFSIKGKFISDGQTDPSEQIYGIAYIEDSNIWYPLGQNEVAGISGLFSGYEPNVFYGGVGQPNVSLLNVEYTGNLSGDRSALYDIWTAMDSLKDGFSDFQEIILEGVSIGSGRVTEFNFPQSRDPRISEFEVMIETYSTGDFTNFTSGLFSNVVWDYEGLSRALDISESISSSVDEDGIKTFDRSLDLTLINNELNGADFALSAKNIASGILSGDPALSNFYAAYPNYYSQSGRRIFSESYDTINGRFSFQESFACSNDNNFYLKSNLSLSIGEDGRVSCSENGTITINRNPIMDYLYPTFDIVKSYSQQNINEMFSGYTSTGCSALYLNGTQQSFDLARGVIEYTFDYTNDPYSSGGYWVTRETNITIADNGEISMSENGTVKTVEGPNGSGRLSNSLDYFNNNISGGILGRLYSHYSGMPFYYSLCQCDGTGLSPLSSYYVVSTENSYSEYEGLFGYSRGYKNSCSSLSDNQYIVSTTRNVTYPIPKIWKGITLNSGELVQYQNTNNLISDSQSVKVKSLETGKVLGEYLSKAVEALQPPSREFYTTDISYTLQPNSLSLDFNVTYNYTGVIEDLSGISTGV